MTNNSQDFTDKYFSILDDSFDEQGFIQEFGVSRETLERFQTYEALLKKWQRIKNLVSPKTLDEIWHRHFADSAQLIPLIGEGKTIVDLGSGAGFPGLVLAILLAERGGGQVHLVEANARKCAFLREMVRKLAFPATVSVEIHNGRIEDIHDSSQSFDADIVTARALAPLTALLSLAAPFYKRDGQLLFLKGRDLKAELEAARQMWDFDFETINSRTDSDGRIIVIRHLKYR